MVGTQDCEAVERAARALAGLTTDEPWPTNAALGGGPTGTRDDEYRAAMIDQADAALSAAGWAETQAEVERLRGVERGWQHDRSEWEAERNAALARATSAEQERDRLRDEVDRLRAGIEAFGQDLTLYADLEAACMAERSPSTLADKVQDIMADRLRALAGSGEQPGANSKPAPSSAKTGRNDRPAPVDPDNVAEVFSRGDPLDGCGHPGCEADVAHPRSWHTSTPHGGGSTWPPVVPALGLTVVDGPTEGDR